MDFNLYEVRYIMSESNERPMKPIYSATITISKKKEDNNENTEKKEN